MAKKQVRILILLEWNEIVFFLQNKSPIKHNPCSTPDYDYSEQFIQIDIDRLSCMFSMLHGVQNTEHRQDQTCMAKALNSEQRSTKHKNACCIHASTRSFAYIMLESLEFLFLFFIFAMYGFVQQVQSLKCENWFFYSIQHFLSSMYFIVFHSFFSAVVGCCCCFFHGWR